MSANRRQTTGPLRPLLALQRLEEAVGPLLAAGGGFAPGPLRGLVLAAYADQLAAEGRSTLIVCADEGQARTVSRELSCWLGEVRLLPERGVSYESGLLPSPHLVGLRLAALGALEGDRPVTVVAPAGALCELAPEPQLRPSSFRLRKGEQLELDKLVELLAAAGYERVEQVQERGEYAVRGGLLDLFPVTTEQAVRVDFFGEEIDSLRAFSTFTQRSLGDLAEVEVAPAAELPLEVRELLRLAAAEREEGGEPPAVAELLPVDRFKPPLALLGSTVALALAHRQGIEAALAEETAEEALEQRQASGLYLPPSALAQELRGRAELVLEEQPGEEEPTLHGSPLRSKARSVGEAEIELERLLNSGYLVAVCFSAKGEGERFAYNLKRLKPSWLEGGSPPPAKGLLFAVAPLEEGFSSPQLRLAVVPARRLVVRPRPQAGAVGAAARAVRSFAQLRTGDIVVHEDHGIARFAGFQTRTVAGVTRDYLYLEYAGEDRVWVPTDQLAKITRYASAEAAADGKAPPLSKLGSKRFDQLKARARAATKELAGELLALYAERARRRGHAFGPDSEWVRDLEARFPYTETPDQLAAIEAVKADMESERPMDRLICGDVGFGKTEVALRAALKAATDSKQVLVLAPTTVLVQQHYGTFSERLADYPIRVDYVSRLRSPSQQREVLKEFAEGKVDILIGTHRLLSRDLRAKDLGLLIIDEEQRFGVRQKELLRSLKLSIDVISMSATPIPRTLQISLAGLRDISVIETPPEGRRPVHTYVGEHDERLIKRALEREKARGGQSFYLHNRVETIEQTAQALRALCPQLRFAVAHGQMDEQQLEEVMLAFLRGEADVLVCTSIIESGLDVPRANTLIVEEADRFGLAQLYQIRGRVGRRRERAYAYLLYNSAAGLSEQAAKRLAALSDHTELGSGFALAMRDLELRGAGDLLGEEQSGHFAALGFELYMQMLQEAIADLSDQQVEEAPEPVRLDVKVDAYLPADYIPYERAKVEFHRRLAQARELGELEAIRAELLDRFGPPPEPVENLVALTRARILFATVGIRDLTFKGGRVVVSPLVLGLEGAKRVHRKLADALYEASREQLTMRVAGDGRERFDQLVRLAELLFEIKQGERSAAEVLAGAQ